MEGFPGRESEIRSFLSLLGQPRDEVPPVWISGAAGVGKSVVIKYIMQDQALVHSTSNCVECFTPKLLFEDILLQLGLEDACHRPSDFVRKLQGLLSGRKETTFIVLDNAQLLRSEQASEFALLLPAFLSLSSLTKTKVSTIFLSRLVWPKVRSEICFIEPIQIHFTTYSKEDILRIIEKDCRMPEYLELHQYLAKLLFNIFSLVTRDLNELRRLTSLLFPRIVQPVIKGEMSMSDKVKLYHYIDPYVKQVSRHIYLNDFSIKEWENEKQNQVASGTANLAVELPSRLKWLLVASYIASNNPPNHDTKYFGDISVKKNKRSSNKTARVRRRFAMPTAFSFDRMIAIYFAIYEDNSRERTPMHDSELYTQVQTLISLNLLTLAGARGIIEAVKLRCNISFDFAKSLSQNLDFDLTKYLQDA